MKFRDPIVDPGTWLPVHINEESGRHWEGKVPGIFFVCVAGENDFLFSPDDDPFTSSILSLPASAPWHRRHAFEQSTMHSQTNLPFHKSDCHRFVGRGFRRCSEVNRIFHTGTTIQFDVLSYLSSRTPLMRGNAVEITSKISTPPTRLHLFSMDA